MGDHLFWPHHDGSAAYVEGGTPSLGQHVTVRVRTSTKRPVDRVVLRTVEDAEPFFAECAEIGRDEHAVWWEGRVHVCNPVQRYRFMVTAGDSYVWLNAAGVHTHDVPDACDFILTVAPPAPEWGRDATIYQIFPDRFARSAAAAAEPTPHWAVAAEWDDPPIHVGPDTPLQFFGGDLDGITEHLDHLESLGMDCVYLTPVFPGESNHRYNASTFDEVDPLLGGDDAYRRLIDAAHARGMTVLGDLTSNHTGDTHEWFLAAREDVHCPERDFYYFAADGSYEGWKGHGTLPKLNYLDAELAARMHGVVQRWLEFGIDGWRIDVANMTGRRGEVDILHEVARGLRAAAADVRPDALVLAEHGHDASGDLDGDGWHGTMNYYGFSFPVWTWLRRPDGTVPSYGLPVGQPRRGGHDAFRTMREFHARFGWQAVNSSWNILGSHDTPRIRTVTGSADRHHAAIVLQFCLPGVPMVFAGDELGQEGVDGEDSRRTMPWESQADWDTRTSAAYRALADLRRSHLALRRGGLRWVHLDEDVVGFLREHPSGSALVVVSRGGSSAFTLDAGALAMPDSVRVALGDGPLPSDGELAVPAYDEATAVVWTW